MTNDSSSYENIIEIDGLHLKYLLFLFISPLYIKVFLRFAVEMSGLWLWERCFSGGRVSC